MIRIRYDLIGAFKSGIEIHPQLDLKSIDVNIEFISYEPCPIADCIFMDIKNLSKELPKYIKIIN